MAIEKIIARFQRLPLEIDTRHRLTNVLFFIALITPSVLLTISSAVIYKSVTTKVAIAHKDKRVILAASILTEKLDGMVALACSTALRPLVIKGAGENQWADAMGIASDLLSVFSGIDSIVLTDRDGIIQDKFPGTKESISKSVAGQDWYKGLSREWKPYVSAIFLRIPLPRYNVVGIAVPIVKTERASHLQFALDKEVNEIIGALLLQIRNERFAEWIESNMIGVNSEEVYIVDQQGQLIIGPGFEPQGKITSLKQLPVVQKVLAGESGHGIISGFKSPAEALVSYAPIIKYGWGILISEPTRSFFSERDRAIKMMLFLGGVIVAMNAFFASWVLTVSRHLRISQENIGKANAALKERIIQVESSNKELDSLSYAIAHDLRSPLRAISSFANILIDEYRHKLDEEGQRILSIVKKNTILMDQLITDLLAFGHIRIKEMKMDPVNMRALAEEMFGELIFAFPERQMELDTQKAPPIAYGDRAMIKQILANLFSNAIKFTRKKERAIVEFGGREEGREIVYYVKDNGVGFDVRYVGKLFKIFQRLHKFEEYEGTGVGLSIVSRIVERHGGRVWAESVDGENACFYFTLPKKA